MIGAPPVGTPSPSPDSTGAKIYHCGPLSYTLRGLMVLFAWLLWGDFVFTLMETAGPAVLPLKLKALGISNTMMQVIMTTLPGILNMTVCPWVSYKSDRHRGRWGRRIPFILWTMPFLVLCLVLVGFSDELTVLAQRHIPVLGKFAPASVTIAFIGLFWVSFSFFNMFVGSVYWYLFNDVVPPQFLGRFFGLFRLVGTGAGMLFNFLVFEYLETNMREILIGASLLYLVGFGLMCLFVKEGPYPPPPEESGPKGIAGVINSFGKQCFSSRFYWYFYLMNAFGAAAGACGLYGIFFSKQMGLTVKQIGQLNGWILAASLAATYFTAIFVDRWHPLRISAYNAVFAAVTGFGGWIWVVVTLPSHLYFWLSLGGGLVTRFGAVLNEGCGVPLFMRLMPKSLYGQFSSANSIIRSFATIVAGILAGIFMDIMVKFYGGDDFAYRWIFMWAWVFGAISAVFVVLGYREWLRLGGDEHYRPPAPWTESGFEEVTDRVPTVPARPRAVMLAMWLGFGGAMLNIILVGIFMYFMKQHEMNKAVLWYLKVFMPLKIVMTILSYIQVVHVKRDIVAREAGQTTRYGIPHHGVLLVNAIQGLVYFAVFWYQTVEMIHLNLERELILFGMASLASTFAGIVGVQLVRWMERDVELAPGVLPVAEVAESVPA